MLDEFNCLTLKILCRTAMGVDVGKENPEMGSHKDYIIKPISYMGYIIQPISGARKQNFCGTFEKISINTDMILKK